MGAATGALRRLLNDGRKTMSNYLRRKLYLAESGWIRLLLGLRGLAKNSDPLASAGEKDGVIGNPGAERTA